MQSLCRIADEVFESIHQLRAQYPNCPASRGAAAATLITHVTDRAGHDRRYAIDCRKIKAELGYDAAIRLETGLRATLDWYLAHPAWWQAVMDGSYRNWIKQNYSP